MESLVYALTVVLAIVAFGIAGLALSGQVRLWRYRRALRRRR